jgi:glucuronokinase
VRIARARAFARAALLGNPSDAYGGRTISFAFTNFSAAVVVYEWPRLEIVPGPSDQVSFANLRELAADVDANGYYGGLRVVKATLKRFADWCGERSIPVERPFSIRYESSIPRGVGLGGSSAIVTAVLRGLFEFHEAQIPLEELPGLALSVETEELGIAAGLQDRVAQAYQGLTYMDFDPETSAARGHGSFEPLDPGLLPPTLIAYSPGAGQPSHEAHRAVRDRFVAGDQGVRTTIAAIAELADRGREALLSREAAELGRLMSENLSLRRRIFRLHPEHLRMAEVAAELGMAANYAGSGGAIVVMAEDAPTAEELARRLRAEGCAVIEPRIAEGLGQGPPG